MQADLDRQPGRAPDDAQHCVGGKDRELLLTRHRLPAHQPAHIATGLSYPRSGLKKQTTSSGRAKCSHSSAKWNAPCFNNLGGSTHSFATARANYPGTFIVRDQTDRGCAIWWARAIVRDSSAERAGEFFQQHPEEIYRNTDRWFAKLMFFQWHAR